MADAASLEQQIKSTPGLLQALLANQKKPLQVGPRGALQARAGTPEAEKYQLRTNDILQQFGVENPGGDYIIGIDKSTQQPYVRDQSWFERNASWVMPLAIVGGGAIAGAVTGGAAPATSAISSTAGGAGTSGVADGMTSFAAAGAPSTAANIAPAVAASSPGLWGSVIKTALGTAVPIAAQLVSANMQAKSAAAATDASAKANADALDWLKTQYNNRQTQLAPYIQAGTASIGTMARSMGLNGSATSVSPAGAQMQQGSSFSGAGQPANTAALTNVQTRPSTPAENAATQTGQTVPAGAEPLVTMKAPGSGQTKQVPVSQQAYYESKGATRVA